MRQSYLFLISVFFFSSLFAQSKTTQSSWDVQFLNGVILEHNPDIAHLILGRTNAVLLKYNRKTYGDQTWQQHYNYPDWGASFMYQDMGNPELGINYSLYGHYNFYFLQRHLNLSIGTGIAYTTNPYDPITNPRNVAYGSSLMSASFLGMGYKKERLFHNIGLEAGILITHYSNGRLRVPNTSTNVFSFNLGLNYTPFKNGSYNIDQELPEFSESLRLNVALIGGANENNIVGLGRRAFFGIQAFVDKRISYKSSFQLGAELFVSGALEDFIRYRAAAFPEMGINGDEDAKRAGVFVGYELRISQIAAFVQLGYYAYYPVDFEDRFYNRLGLKRFFGKHWFAQVAVKAHAGKAENIDFGIGYRL